MPTQEIAPHVFFRQPGEMHYTEIDLPSIPSVDHLHACLVSVRVQAESWRRQVEEAGGVKAPLDRLEALLSGAPRSIRLTPEYNYVLGAVAVRSAGASH